MTEAQIIQYNRFIEAGYDPADARMMIKRGAWLSTPEMSAETVAAIEEYRRERDKGEEASEHMELQGFFEGKNKDISIVITL